MKMKVPIGVSVRHAHLTKEHMEILFGVGYKLERFRELYQPVQYATEYTVDLVGPKHELKNVRVLGPENGFSQVEISKTDAFYLGVDPPVRASGDIAGSASIKLIGPQGEVVLQEGCIIANRHIHLHTSEAEKYNIKATDLVDIKLGTIKPTILRGVSVKIKDTYQMELHIDTDDANAALVKTGEYAELITINEWEIVEID